MNTEDLIDTLARQQPSGVHKPGYWAFPLVAALLAGLFFLTLVLGQPLEALPQIGAAPYIMKLAFTVSVVIVGGLTLRASGNPGRRLAAHVYMLAIPFLAVLTLAGLEIAFADPSWPGRTWLRCITAIALIAPIAFAACIVSLRRLAPTCLPHSGALAGIVSGSIAASAYALWCPETTAIFLLTWYALPILAMGGIGALLGPLFLRW